MEIPSWSDAGDPPRAPLILASTSPRRIELLRQAGVCFEVVQPPAEEATSHPEGPRALVLHNARCKARSVAELHPQRVVLAADTIVLWQGKILGKPADMAHARAMLRQLSGQVHEVLTGVCLGRHRTPTGPRFCEFVISSRVQFHPLTTETIESYLQSIQPLDKAGAYAAQDDAGRCIARVEGSMDNVIGLPVREVRQSLARHFPETLP